MKYLEKQFLEKLLRTTDKKIQNSKEYAQINALAENLVTTLLEAEFCSLWYYQEKNMALLRNRDSQQCNILYMEEKIGIIYKSFMTKESKIYNYLSSDTDYIHAIDNPDGIKIQSKIIVPLLHNEKFVGIVTAYTSSNKPKKFTRTDLEYLEMLTPFLVSILYRMHDQENKDVDDTMFVGQKAIDATLQNFQKLQEQQEIEESPDEILLSMANFIHDIRTPSNTLQGSLELLEEQIVDKRLKEHLNNAKESALFINELTTLMLDKISLHRERKISQVAKVETTKFFSNVIEMFVSNMYKKDLEFDVFIDPLLPKTLELNSLKLKRVLMNLIGNAYKFTPRSQSISLSVEYDKAKNSIAIFVKDTGIGIPKEKQEQIFEAFKQAQEHIFLDYGGTGLGLSICAEYVREMGGELRLESDLDKGSIFYFHLPIQKSSSQACFTPLNDDTINIAIVTDKKDISVVQTIQRYLLKMGIDKNNLTVVDQFEKIPLKKSTHLVVMQHKLQEDMEELFNSFKKVLIVEEQLFSIASDGCLAHCEVISCYDYYAYELYKFINTQKIPKVLLVDDDKTSIFLLEKILENEYCSLEIAKDGQSALDMILQAYSDNAPYDIVYIDNKMPFISGVEVMKRVREYEKQNDLDPLYSVSTSGEIVDANEYFSEFVGKPFKAVEIRNVLHHFRAVENSKG